LGASLNSEILVQGLPIPVSEASVSQIVNYSDTPDNRKSISEELTEVKEVKSAVSENFHSTTPSGTALNSSRFLLQLRSLLLLIYIYIFFLNQVPR